MRLSSLNPVALSALLSREGSSLGRQDSSIPSSFKALCKLLGFHCYCFQFLMSQLKLIQELIFGFTVVRAGVFEAKKGSAYVELCGTKLVCVV